MVGCPVNIVACHQEIANRAGTIPELHTFGYPADAIVPDTFEVNLPESINLDETYGRGKVLVTTTANLMVGRKQDRSSTERLLRYFTPGERDLVAAIERGDAHTCDWFNVPSVVFAVFPVGGVEYLGAHLTITYVGSREGT